MTFKKTFLRWAVAVLAVLMLAACGSSTSSTSGNTTVQKAQTGQVTFKIQFPQTALKKALIDDRTASIFVSWYPYRNYSTQAGYIELTPDPVTHIATATVDIPVGAMVFQAIAKDINGTELDKVTSAGMISTGSNTVIMTFLRGDWQFVDANDNPLPQDFGTMTLAGFSLSGMSYGGPSKATTDPTKPRGWSDYNLQWQSGTVDPFTPVGPTMWSGQTTQFNGPGFTGSAFGSDWLNVTDPSRSDSLNNDAAVPYVQGDRLIWIMEWEEDGPTSITDNTTSADLIPQFKAFGDTQVLDGNHIGGHIMAMTFENLVQSAATATGVDCTAFWYAQHATPAAARAAAIKASLAKPAGKAAIGDNTPLTADTITAAYSDCYEDTMAAPVDGDGDNDYMFEQLTYDANGNWRYDAGDTFIDSNGDGHWDFTYTPGTTYDFTEQYSNVVATEFRAKGSQAGSVFAPPSAAAMIGTWVRPANVDGNAVIMTILDEATYTLIEDDPNGISTDFEYGNFTFDIATGTFTPYLLVDTNPSSGPSGAGGPLNVSISGNTMTIVGGPTFTKLAVDPSKPIVGSWAVQESNPTVVTYLADGTYYISQNEQLSTGISAGIERGTYSYNGTILTATPLVQTHAGGAGFGTIGVPANINFTISADNATISDIDYSVSLKRVVAPTVPAPIYGSWYMGSGANRTLMVVTMLDNNTVVYGDSDPYQPGIEYGSFTFSPGNFIATTSIDTTGPYGFTGLTGLFPYIYSMGAIDGDGSILQLQRVRSNVDFPILGTWGGIDLTTGDGVTITFLDNGSFMFIQTSPADAVGQPGNEWGTYSWDSGTGNLTPNILGDLNGQWGMSHVGAISITVGFNAVTGKDELTWQDNDGIRTVPRLY